MRVHKKSEAAWKYSVHTCITRPEKEVVTRKLQSNEEIELTIRVYTNRNASLASQLPKTPGLEIVNVELKDNIKMPQYASMKLLEEAGNYDILGYMEDDISIEERDFFGK